MSRYTTSSTRSPLFVSIVGFIVIVLCSLLGYAGMSVETVEPGNVGVVFNRAQRQVTEELAPGWHFRNPFTTRITEYPVSAQTLEMVRVNGGIDDSVKVGTSDGQSMWADVAIQWSVERDEAAEMYSMVRGLGVDYITQNFVRQISRSVMNDIASQYKWDEAFGPSRVEYSQKVRDELTRRFDEKHLKLEDFNLRGWHLPENLAAAVNQNQQAVEAIKQRNAELQQARVQAQQQQVQADAAAAQRRSESESEAFATRTKAQAEAEAAKQQAEVTKTQAQAEAESIRVRAQAQAEANRAIAESLNENLLRLEQIQKWNGDVPTYNTPGAPVPFVEVPAQP